MCVSISRSHTIFSVTVHTKESSVDGEDLLKTGKMNLVDLAGSENISKSGVTDKRARETSMINTSLLTLGRCIVALTEHRGHIPYRESKLTRLLRDSLGGRTKTSLIATVSPALCNLEETLNTLDYASRAKHITNKPEMNQRLTKNALLKDYEDQISKLQRDLQATRLCNGIYVAADNYDEMLKELAIQKQEITDKINNIRALKDEMEEKERICCQLEIKIQQQLGLVREKNDQIDQLQIQLDTATAQISTLHYEKEMTEFLVAKHSEQEQVLHVTAVKLLNTAETSTTDIDKLHNKLDLLADLNNQNKLTYEQHINEFNNKIAYIQNKSTHFHTGQDRFQQCLLDYVAEMRTKQNELNDTMSKLVDAYPNYLIRLRDEQIRLGEQGSSLAHTIHNSTDTFNQLSEVSNKQTELAFQEHLHPLLQDINRFLEKQQQLCQSFVNSFNELVNENAATLTSSINELKEDMTKAKQQVYDKLEKMNSQVHKVILWLVSSSIEEQRAQMKAEQDLKIAMRLISDSLGDRQSRLPVTSRACEQLSKITNEISSCHLNVSELAQVANIACTDVLDNVAGRANEATMLSDAVIETNKKSYCEGSSICDRLHMASQDIIYQCRELRDEQLKQQNDILSKIECGLRDTVNGTSCFMQQLQAELEQQHFSHNQINQESRQYYNQSLASIEMQTYESKSQNSQHESLAMTELDVCRENVKKLFTTHIKEYKPTGYTPLRKKYKYPKSVPPTTSSEAVLQHFHAQRKQHEDNNKLDMFMEVSGESDTEDTDPTSPSENKENVTIDRSDKSDVPKDSTASDTDENHLCSEPVVSCTVDS